MLSWIFKWAKRKQLFARLVVSLWLEVLSSGGFSSCWVFLHVRVISVEILFEFFKLNNDFHNLCLNFDQVLEHFSAFRQKHPAKCIFQGKVSSSLFIIRSMFQERKTFYLPFKHKQSISSWLGGLLEFEAVVHKMHFSRKACVVYWARLQLFRPNPSVTVLLDRGRCKQQNVCVKEPSTVDSVSSFFFLPVSFCQRKGVRVAN